MKHTFHIAVEKLLDSFLYLNKRIEYLSWILHKTKEEGDYFMLKAVIEENGRERGLIFTLYYFIIMKY